MPDESLDHAVSIRRILRLLIPTGQRNELTVFRESVRVAGLRIKCVGFWARVDPLGEITGSAAGIIGDVSRRALSEFVERFVSREAELESRKCGGRLQGVTLNREKVEISAESLFPQTEPGWIHSRSSGVACHRSAFEAGRSAVAELIERDRFLRSWYGEFPPRRTCPPESVEWASLRTLYQMECLDLGEGVAVVVGFPLDPSTPLLLGLACRETPEEARRAALREAIQRLAFLWNEEIPRERPVDDRTPLFHLSYYLWPGSHVLLKEWIEGVRSRREAFRPVENDIVLVELSKGELSEERHVIKAVSASRMPLVFGVSHPWITDEESRMPWAIHPIA